MNKEANADKRYPHPIALNPVLVLSCPEDSKVSIENIENLTLITQMRESSDHKSRTNIHMQKNNRSKKTNLF